DQGQAELGAVLVEVAAVKQGREHVTDIVLGRGVGSDDLVEILAGTPRRLDGRPQSGRLRVWWQQRDQPTQPCQAGVVGRLAIIDRAADRRVHLGSAQVLV